MSARRPSPYCEAHPNGTHLRCLDCAAAREAARPQPLIVGKAPREVPLPTPAEMIVFEARWPDRAARQRFDGELLAHDEALWKLWRMSAKAFAVRMVWALRHHREECVAADPATTRRLVEKQERQAEAYSARSLVGLS